ncbi:MAG TPA: hypothetical protein V6D33_04660 [Cyanophyceae cyanobacterium]
MAGRTQINFRVDDELLTAIKAHCETQGVSQTDFVIGAIKNALGIQTPSSMEPNTEVIDERIDSRLAPVWAELAEIKLRLGSELGELTAVLKQKVA